MRDLLEGTGEQESRKSEIADPSRQSSPQPTGAVRQALSAAIARGEIVRIAYHGGSRPGAVRDVRPISVTTEYLRAHDLAAELDKTYRLSEIELTDHPITPDPQTVEEAVSPYLRELQECGWHVVVTRDGAHLYARFKNGKLRKGASVSLTYEAQIVTPFIDLDGSEGEERRDSKRPYHVAGTAGGSFFGSLWKAGAKFLDDARRLAPGAADGVPGSERR